MKIVTRLFIKYFVPLSAISLGVISMPSFAEMQISIEAYPGTKLIREHEQDFLVYPIATQAIDDDEFSPLNVEGRYSHRFYEGELISPLGRSRLRRAIPTWLILAR